MLFKTILRMSHNIYKRVKTKGEAMGSNLGLFLLTHFKHMLHLYHRCSSLMFPGDILQIKHWLEMALETF